MIQNIKIRKTRQKKGANTSTVPKSDSSRVSLIFQEKYSSSTACRHMFRKNIPKQKLKK